MQVQIKDIIQEIESIAPLVYQESYDNSGVQIGRSDIQCTGVLISLDATITIVNEAISKQCNLIITHHPLLFKGLKRISGNNEIEQIVIACIKNDITLYACHTNLDNVTNGVNYKIAEKLSLNDVRILQPTKGNLYKLITYIPHDQAEEVLNKMWQAGAGKIGNYDECSFQIDGMGTFRGNKDSNPAIGKPLTRTTIPELRAEVLVNSSNKSKVIAAMKNAHPYEEVAYELINIQNENQTIGAGIIGYLNTPMNEKEFLKYVKSKMNLDVIKYTPFSTRNISKIGVCGGSGSFLLGTAIAQQCDAFITGDMKYHEFFLAENNIMITDIGHYESEQYTSEIFYDIIKNKFPNFAVQISGYATNPIKYYY